jgi:hypothetical protein
MIMRSKTAVIAKPLDRTGELYQRRAVEALPLLVRQARAGETIYYGNLAAELKMPNARNLNFILGSIGTSLIQLASLWGSEVPPLQALVVNRQDEMPGSGFVHSLANTKVLEGVSKRTRKQIIDGMLAKVYSYTRWKDVLRHFEITPVGPAIQIELLKRAGTCRGSGGEGEEHLRLKHFVASNPQAIGIRQRVRRTTMEYRLPSGDEVDVLFELRRKVVAVEVKAKISSEEEVVRGVFQCVKYEALLNAEAKAIGSNTDVDVILGLGGTITAAVQRLANTLGVSLVAGIDPIG